MSSRALILSTLVAAVMAGNQLAPDPAKHLTPTAQGACVSGNWTLSNPAMFRDIAPAEYLPKDHNPVQYPFAIMLETKAVTWDSTGMSISLTTSSHNAVTIAFGRYIRYARISVKMTAGTQPGLVTTLITMSDRGDEIDWETVGKDTTHAQSNVWWNSRALANNPDKLDPNVGKHGGVHPKAATNTTAAEPPITIGNSNIYTFDWKSTSLTWSVNGFNYRTITPSSENGNAVGLTNGTNYYPTEPSLIKLGIWDASLVSGDWAGVADWSNPNAVYSAKFEWLAIQCYDGNNNPVAQFGDMAVPTATINTLTTTKNSATETAEHTVAPIPVTGTSNDGLRVVAGLAGALVVVALTAMGMAM
ncbi:hypothetical protein HDV00_004570 [Rhizophlyctis rosea]|nr:hypothetical protein HDV00_004570 [Rhizophlyctis rosea]